MEIKNIKKVLFLGLGGAGQRHLRILNVLIPNCEFLSYRHTEKTPLLNNKFEIDKNYKINEKYPLKIFRSIQEAFDQKPDLAIISTPTSTHLNLVLKCLDRGINVLVEKPCITCSDDFKKLIKGLDSVKIGFHVGFQRQFHPHLERLKSDILKKSIGRIINFKVNVSSFMPSWHSYEDYRNLYAAKEELGGGVVLTEIHELYFLLDIFGMPLKITGFQKKDFSFDLEVPHSALIQLHYAEFIVELNLSFISKKTERKIIVNGDMGWIECDIDNSVYKINDISGNFEEDNKHLSPEDLFIFQLKNVLSKFNLTDNLLIENLKNMGDVLDTIKKLPIY